MAALSDEADRADGLSFPDVPRLELDQLLVQLVDNAEDVMAAQQRLRGLLHANALVASELSLPAVLRQIVAAARGLLGARYAALGVLGDDGRLEQFVHAGMDDELVRKVGDLPKGFLGVPIRIGKEVFGNLYLTERAAGGEFTADDEELAVAIAAAAGAAIGNARRFTESEQRRRWLDASSELTPLLLSAGATKPHVLITRHAAAAAEADFAMLAVPRSTDQMIVAGAYGALAAHLMDRTVPLADSLAGQVMFTGMPCAVADGHTEAAAMLGAGVGPLMIVPLAAGEHVRGVLMLGRPVTGPGFTETELEAAASYASHAAAILELAQARLDQITLAQVEDHDRIAADLQDHVVQDLFALGMSLQGHASRLDSVAAERVNGYADTLDQVIARIRTSIFGLRQPRHHPGGLPARLLGIIEEQAPQLGFTADIRFAGPLELNTNMTLADDILAVTREALSNCARHAHATAVGISLALQDGLITLDIADNGRGRGMTTRSSGLTSMRHRAERNGGTFQLTTPGSGGTHLTWTARGGTPDRPS
jgi:signal transduction histidine kinase